MILDLLNLIAALVIFAKVATVLNRANRRTRISYMLPVALFGLAAMAAGLEPLFTGLVVSLPRAAFSVTAAVAVWACARSRPRRRYDGRGGRTW